MERSVQPEPNWYPQPDDLETCIHDLQSDVDQAEINNIELVFKLRDIAADLEVIWERCRYVRFGTSGLKTAAGFISAAGGVCILCATGPIMPLVVAGTGGLILGSMGNYGMAKLEHYLSSKKFSELVQMVELNSDLLQRIQDRVNQVCSLDRQTLQALLRTADRLVRPDHSLFPFFQTVRQVMSSVQMDPMNEVSSVFGILGQIEGLGGQLMSATLPAELAGLGQEARNGETAAANARKSDGFQKFGGLLLIVTGILSAYSSGQELVELIRTQKSEAVELLKAKADDIESKLRPFEFLRD